MATIKLFATLRDIAGGIKTLDVPLDNVETARDLALAISGASPPLGKELLDAHGELTGRVHILVNGRNIEWLDGLDTPVNSGDLLVLIPPAAGG